MNLADLGERREWLRRLQVSAENRARKSGVPFRLRPGFAATIYDRQGGRCAVSGYEFNLRRFRDALVKHPFAPSIDRKLSTGGYTEENVRLVCVAVNFGMGQWGEEVYMTLARAAVERERKDRTDPNPAGDRDWHIRQREKIAAAEALQIHLPEPEASVMTGRIAALKRAETMGPERLRQAARKARETRKRREGA